MESIREIYRIGEGPSSSHTMGPKKAASLFAAKNQGIIKFRVTLYGSLAATGRGHLTDKAILSVLGANNVHLVWKPEIFLPQHPNGMLFEALNEEGKAVDEWTVFSIGGGKITDFQSEDNKSKIYELTSMDQILHWSEDTGHSFREYVEQVEGVGIYDYLAEVWQVMTEAIGRGIEEDGLLPGGLNVRRKAASYHVKAKYYTGSLHSKTLLFSYALAVSEENASGGVIATAPTCGSSGVLPAVLYRLKESYHFSDQKILRALATAGLIGNIVKTNASISGAEVGCQGEIGTACAMASGAVAQLLGGTPSQIEYAAEMGMEHHLGLTCDPVGGLVQIPCIERNAFAAERAMNTATFALLSDGRHLISFDKIVKAMNQTGHDLPSIYKETSEGGMAILDR
jgi:L-serine dehydratase